MNLRKRPQHDDVAPFTNESQRIGRIVEEFKVSFIENYNHLFRNPRYEAVDRAPRNQSARLGMKIRRVFRVNTSSSQNCFSLLSRIEITQRLTRYSPVMPRRGCRSTSLRRLSRTPISSETK